MRAPVLVCTLASCLFACGGQLAPYDGGPPDAPVAEPDTSPGDDQASPPVVGFCVYQTCSGLSLCGVGKTCPVGDGCNSCSCAAAPDGMAASTCSTTKCSCP